MHGGEDRTGQGMTWRGLAPLGPSHTETETTVGGGTLSMRGEIEGMIGEMIEETAEMTEIEIDEMIGIEETIEIEEITGMIETTEDTEDEEFVVLLNCVTSHHLHVLSNINVVDFTFRALTYYLIYYILLNNSMPKSRSRAGSL